MTPVFFGSARWATSASTRCSTARRLGPAALSPPPTAREIAPEEEFTGFVFKIQANMDPSTATASPSCGSAPAKYQPGHEIRHVRLKEGPEDRRRPHLLLQPNASMPEAAYMPATSSACTTTAPSASATPSPRRRADLYRHSRLCPELFRRARLRAIPLKMKARRAVSNNFARKGDQLFRLLNSNDLILGAVGIPW